MSETTIASTVDDHMEFLRDVGDGYWELPSAKLRILLSPFRMPARFKVPASGSVFVSLWNGSKWEEIHVENYRAEKGQEDLDVATKAHDRAKRRAVWILSDTKWSDGSE